MTVDEAKLRIRSDNITAYIKHSHSKQLLTVCYGCCSVVSHTISDFLVMHYINARFTYLLYLPYLLNFQLYIQTCQTALLKEFSLCLGIFPPLCAELSKK